MPVTFECATRSRHPVEVMFDRARNIDEHTASQAGADERAVGGVVTGLIGPDEEVTWKARHFGVTFTMSSRIVAYDAPRSFTDEQVRGPFERFRHEHVFEPLGTGSVMIDRVSFAAPFGILGRIAERLVLERYLRRLIEDRGRFLADGE